MQSKVTRNFCLNNYCTESYTRYPSPVREVEVSLSFWFYRHLPDCWLRKRSSTKKDRWGFHFR